jgi:hypothetical protein
MKSWQRTLDVNRTEQNKTQQYNDKFLDPETKTVTKSLIIRCSNHEDERSNNEIFKS